MSVGKSKFYLTDPLKSAASGITAAFCLAVVIAAVTMEEFIAAGVFAVIAILVVFNTIRMAIFNRKEEIYMMRLVGASRWFIVGPFVVEASIYGIVAAIITCGIIYGAVYGLKPHFDGVLDDTYGLMVQYWYLVIASLIAAGILIGIVSSMFATSKYLKQK